MIGAAAGWVRAHDASLSSKQPVSVSSLESPAAHTLRPWGSVSGSHILLVRIPRSRDSNAHSPESATGLERPISNVGEGGSVIA